MGGATVNSSTPSSIQRININLSTGRYVRSAIPAILTGVLFLVALVYTSYNIYSHNVNKKQTAVYERLASSAEGKVSDRAMGMNRKDIRALSGKANTINEIIYRETFSWTRLLSSLEQTVPRGISIVEIKPDFGKGVVKVEIGGVAKTMDGVLKFVKKLGSSNRFSEVFLVKHSEKSSAAASNEKLAFTVSVRYEEGKGT